MQDRNPSFSCNTGAPLSRRPSTLRTWREIIEGALAGVVLVAGLIVIALYSSLSWSQTNPSFDRQTCWVWGGSGSAGQGQYISCPVNVVTVTRTEVREVKVPVPVPGPVLIERVEMPAKAPEKKIKE